VHPGRGVSAGPELLEAQSEYLRSAMAFVAEEKPAGEATPEALARIAERLNQRYPGHRYPVFLRIGLPAEWARQANVVASPSH